MKQEVYIASKEMVKAVCDSCPKQFEEQDGASLKQLKRMESLARYHEATNLHHLVTILIYMNPHTE